MISKKKRKKYKFQNEIIQINDDRWLYNTPLGNLVSHLFSLESHFSYLSIFLIASLVISYVLLDVYIEDNDAPALTISIILYIYCFGIFGFHIYLLLSLNFYHLRDENPSKTKYKEFIYKGVAILVLLYSSNMLQHASIYSIITRMHEEAFLGIDINADNISRIGTCFYLSVETITGLSTGAIVPHKWPGFLTIGIQSTQSVVLFYLIFGIVISFVYSEIYDKKMKHERSDEKDDVSK
jgi:hypothetical protein